MHRSPMASLNITDHHKNSHCISLIQEPPIHRGSIYSFPSPLSVISADDNPRSAIIFNPSLNIWNIPQWFTRDCQMGLWHLTHHNITLASVYWENNSYTMLTHLHKFMLKNKNTKLIIAIDSNVHHQAWGSPKEDTRGRA